MLYGVGKIEKSKKQSEEMKKWRLSEKNGKMGKLK